MVTDLGGAAEARAYAGDNCDGDVSDPLPVGECVDFAISSIHYD
jgi:hypothetical protein